MNGLLHISYQLIQSECNIKSCELIEGKKDFQEDVNGNIKNLELLSVQIHLAKIKGVLKLKPSQ